MHDDDGSDLDAARRYRRRLRKQRAYQAEYREKLRRSGTPDRDDFAAAVLRIVVSGSARDIDRHGPQWERLIVRELSGKGFEAAVVAQAFRRMVVREVRRMRAEAARREERD